MGITLLIVDDHPVVRDGLRGIFTGDDRFDVVGEAANGAEAIALAEAHQPDVVLMDLRMPQVDGVTAITELAKPGVPSRVLVLTTYDTDSEVLPATEAGATGYLLKDAPREELFRAVEAAAQGQAVLSPAVATRLMGQMRAGLGVVVAAGVGGARPDRAGLDQPGGGRAAVHQRGDGEDAPAARLREAGRQGSRGGGRGGVRAGPAHSAPVTAASSIVAHCFRIRPRRLLSSVSRFASPNPRAMSNVA